MVLKSVHMELRTTEVPVRFLKDQEGRAVAPQALRLVLALEAAWINLRAMFVYGADFFAFKPGIVAARARPAADRPARRVGPIDIGPVTLSLYSMLFGLAFTVIGLQGIFLGCIAQVLFDYTGEATRRWTSVFPYTRTVGIAAAAGRCSGARDSFRLLVDTCSAASSSAHPGPTENHLAVFGATLVRDRLLDLRLHADPARDRALDRRRLSADEHRARLLLRPAPRADRGRPLRRLAQRPGGPPPRAPRRARGSPTSAAATRRRFARSVLAEARRVGAAVDVALAPDARARAAVTAVEGPIAEVLPTLPRRSLDVVALRLGARAPVGARGGARAASRRLLAPGGDAARSTCPRGAASGSSSSPPSGSASARPRRWTTTSATTTPRDLWPMLVAAGFRPSAIRCRRHKFGLNTFAVCRADEENPMSSFADRLPRRDPGASLAGLDPAAIEAVAAGLAERPRPRRAAVHPRRRRLGRARRPRGQRLPQAVRLRGLRADRQRLRAHRADQRRGLRDRLQRVAARLAARRRRRAARLLGRRRRRRARASRPTSSRAIDLAREPAPRCSGSSAATAVTPRAVADACVVIPPLHRRSGSRPTPRACARSSGTCWSATRRCSASATKWESVQRERPARTRPSSSSAAPASSAATSSTPCSADDRHRAVTIYDNFTSGRSGTTPSTSATRGSRWSAATSRTSTALRARRWPATTWSSTWPRTPTSPRRWPTRRSTSTRAPLLTHHVVEAMRPDRARSGSLYASGSGVYGDLGEHEAPARTTARWCRSRPTAPASSPARR